LLHALNKAVTEVEENLHGGVGLVHITKGNLERIEIPLPPLEVQKEIVAEIEGYQKVINGARAVLDNYRPHIPIHPDWPKLNLSDVAFFQEGPGILAKDFRSEGVPLIRLAGLRDGRASLVGCNYLDPEMVELKWSQFRLMEGDILVLTSATFGNPAIVGTETVGAIFYTGIIRFRPKSSDLDPNFLKTYLGSASFLEQAESLASGAVIRHFGPTHLRQMSISVPPLATQQALVAEIEAEQALVAGNRKLIERFEKKIQTTIARVWGEDEKSTVQA
jgi:type I restriction enzyme M protein